MKKIITKSLYITLVLTGLFWLISSVRFMDIIIHRKNGLVDFCYLMLLNSVEIIITLLPISMSIAILAQFFNMQRNRELVAIRSIGKSLLDIIKPIILAGSIITIILYIMNIYIKPSSISAYRDKLHKIETSLSSSLIRPGEFIKINNKTIYVTKRGSGGVLEGVLINTVENGVENTYYAKHALIDKAISSGDLNIIMKDGIRRWVDKKSGIISVISFDILTTPIKHGSNLINRNIKVGELSLYQLLKRNKKISGVNIDLTMEQKHLEFYNRITLPLLALVFAIVCSCLFLYLRIKHHKSTNTSIFFSFMSIIILQATIQYLSNTMVTLGVNTIPIIIGLMFAIIVPCVLLIKDSGYSIKTLGTTNKLKSKEEEF